MSQVWVTVIVAIGLALPAGSSELPAEPDDVICPVGSARVDELRYSQRVVRCTRPDGERQGPHTEWHTDGRLARFQTFVAAGEWSAIDGLDIAFDPDGTLVWERQHDRGVPIGTHYFKGPNGGYYSVLYGGGRMLDIFPGRVRPSFRCPPGLVVHTRTDKNHIGVSGGSPPPIPGIESWCEDRRQVLLFPPAHVHALIPERVECTLTEEGLVQVSGGSSQSRADRLPLPANFDRNDSEALDRLCSDPGFWRDRRREGPYISRSDRGRPMEEGSFLGGRRHGVWQIHGRACVQYEHGELRGRVPCRGESPEPDPWVEARWEELDAARRKLGWPQLVETENASREIRIWRFLGYPGGYIMDPLRPGAVALRLVDHEGHIEGELATWEPGRAPPGSCHRSDEEGVCAFSVPGGWTWDDLRYELDLLNAWALPSGDALRVPTVVRPNTSSIREGFFLEASDHGKIRRDWYGPLEYEPAPESHQVRGIAGLVDQVWRHTVREPPPLAASGEVAPCDPWVELSAKADQVRVGEPFVFRVRARARYGLTSVSWIAKSGPAPMGSPLGRGLGGGRKKEFDGEVTAVFEEPGTAVLTANARDGLYGIHLGAPHQASEGCGLPTLSVEVVAEEE